MKGVAPLLLATIGMAGASVARPATGPSNSNAPTAFQALVGCRAITDPAARLACFDSRSAELDAATRRRDVVVLDSRQMRDTRRTLFGLSLPKLPFLGDDGAAEVKSVEGVVSRARLDADGRWIIALKDGPTWHQTDGNVVALEPRDGSKVVVRRAALGSFMMSIDRQPGIRVRRVN